MVATKYTLTSRRDDPNAGGNHRKNLVQTLEASLRRLRTDYVDLLWLHMWDGMTPVEEVVRALDDLVSSGKVLYVGISDTPAWVVSQAVTLAEPVGWSPLRRGAGAVLARRPRRRARAAADGRASLGLAFTPWGMLEGGALTGKYLEDTDEPRRYESGGPKTNAMAREVVAVAEELDATPAQVAIAWVRAQPWQLVPIVGARSETQLRENLGALEVELSTRARRAARRDASGFRLGFPREFLESEHVRGLIFGDTFELIDDPPRAAARARAGRASRSSSGAHGRSRIADERAQQRSERRPSRRRETSPCSEPGTTSSRFSSVPVASYSVCASAAKSYGGFWSSSATT